LPDQHSKTEPIALSELALVFLKLGTIAFGGPAAHIAMMEDEFVRKRGWISREEFLDRLAAANLIPGPSSTEVAIFIGQSKRGLPGLIVAGTCFIIPAAVLVCVIAAVYVRLGTLPQAEGILRAIKPAVIAIIVQALWRLAPNAIKTRTLAVIAAASAVLSYLGVSPILVLALAGASSLLVMRAKESRSPQISLLGFAGTKSIVLGASAAAGALSVSASQLFLSFLKIGCVVFGSGYVLLAFLRAEFVDRLHWLTEKQLIDSVAVGQFTPGPVFTTATFIGYVVAGVRGACLATVGIFLPGFLFVAVSGRLLPKIRRSKVASAVLDGVVAGSLALMAVVAWQLGRASVTDWFTMAIFAASAIVVLGFRINSAWVIAGAAAIGCFAR
jgi:chromate transporter